MSERYITVHRSYDPIVIDHLGEMLRESGVAARVLGTRSASLMGAGQSAMSLRIEVPESQAGQATDFLESFFEDEGEELLAREGLLDDEDEAEGDDEPAPLRPILAAVSVVLTFGVGHLYARRGATALVLAAGQVAIWVKLAGAWRWEVILGLYIGFGTIVVFDLVGSQLAVRAHNRGARRGLAAQLLAGIAGVGLAAGIALGVSKKAPEWAPGYLFPQDIEVGDRYPYDEGVDGRSHHGHGDLWIDPFSLPLTR